jgi:hypothetical protein
LQSLLSGGWLPPLMLVVGHGRAYSMNDLVVHTITSASTLQGALENIRGNRLGRALESLEQGLDVDVITLKSLCDQLDSADRERAVESLRWIRDYRRVHPRRSETDLSMFDKNLVADALKLQEQARKILDETK